ncbi:reverse transcriptase family protein [Planctomycetaceae bacterium SH139]
MSKRAVRKQAFCRLIAADLSCRWLGAVGPIERRLRRLTGSRAAWVSKLAVAIEQKYGRKGYCSKVTLRRWLHKQAAIHQAFGSRKTIHINDSAASEIDRPRYRWPVPQAQGDTQLADLLCLKSPRVLDWLLLPHVRRNTTVEHYDPKWLLSSNGRKRIIHQPRPVLKRVQRIIHQHILPAIPVHDAAHAYRAGRSVHSCARQHVNKFVVLRMDLQDFFGSITRRRVSAIFRKAGYDRKTALSLGRLCTLPASPTATNIPAQETYAQRMLAQEKVVETTFVSTTLDRECVAEIVPSDCLPLGAPSSPALANAVAFQLDRRLAGLAGCVGADYTRYSDDLYFSGDASLAAKIDRFATSVAVIVMEEGFKVNFRKTRKMFHGHRQQVLGLTVNQGVNSDRQNYEQLKAILHNCRTRGWRSQNLKPHPHFQLHLHGRIANVASANPNRGAKLLRAYECIDWS